MTILDLCDHRKVRSYFYRSNTDLFLGIESNEIGACKCSIVSINGGYSIMSTWKRGFLEIIAEILESLMSSPLKKTHITFRCNLDSRAVTKYLNILMSVGLVEKSKTDPSFFVISEKGITYRNHFRTFMSMMENELNKIDFNHPQTKEILSDIKIRRH